MKKPPSIKHEQKTKARKESFTRREKDKAKLAGITTMIIVICVLFLFIYSIIQSI